VPSSMPENSNRAYTWAFIHAVVDRNMTFPVADAFSDWFAAEGRHLFGTDLAAAFDHWFAGPHIRKDC
jgi:hypothetical protein